RAASTALFGFPPSRGASRSSRNSSATTGPYRLGSKASMVGGPLKVRSLVVRSPGEGGQAGDTGEGGELAARTDAGATATVCAGHFFNKNKCPPDPARPISDSLSGRPFCRTRG